ncbi:MAG: hypothetical protein MJB14_06390, partial [Spirochaetes bacterium]|nr:hypothetical protein [Spirochaetota bacterium]
KEKEKDEEGKTTIIENPILINPVGMDQFINNYVIEYHESKTKITLADGTGGYKFKLIRKRSSQNSFNVVYLTITETGIIREVEGITAALQKVTLKMTNIKTNQGISDNLFVYDPPSHTNVVDNFITNQGDE